MVALLAFGISAGVLAASDASGSELRAPDLAAYSLLAVYSASPMLRHRAPVLAVFGGLLTGAGYALANYPPALSPVALLSIYTAAAVLPARRARWLLAGAVAVGILGATWAPGPTDTGVPALIAAAWLLGKYVGGRRAYTAELERKNRQLEQAQVELAERAAADERLRIARELHDVVTHTMSVVVVHAGTGRMVADADPAAARQALATIETAARSALVEMRRLLGVLRGSGDERAELAPAPGLDDLGALVADVEMSGLDVTVRLEGERPDVPASVDMCAYRIVQEALTNVIKHAGPVPVTVTVRYADHELTIEVYDDGPSGQLVPSAPTGGHGLIGMRERVAMLHGDFDAGRRPSGGFHVFARLPFGEGT